MRGCISVVDVSGEKTTGSQPAVPCTALVMTATITPPPGAPELARRDPQVRLADYCEALRFYLSLSDSVLHKIVFLDNSDTDLSDLEEAARTVEHHKRVELITFQGNDHPPEFGKGYGEFRLLDHGLSRSTLLEPSDRVWKVTGRLRVLNLERLILTAPTDYQIYADLRRVPLIGESLGGNNWMDLRVFSWANGGYDTYLRDQYEHLGPELLIAPEQYFFKVMRDAGAPGEVVPRFRVQPDVAGYGGRLNVDYKGGSYRYKNALRRGARRVAPWLWL